MSELTYISELTHISSAIIKNNDTRLEELQDIIIQTIARWFDIQQDTMKWSLPPRGVYELCGTDRLQARFELYVNGKNTYRLSMDAVGRFRRNGSSSDYFEKLFDCLLVQINRPYLVFAKMNDCLTLAYPPIKFDFLNIPQASNIFESPLPTVGAVAEKVVYDEEEEESVASLEEEESDEEEEDSDEEESDE